MRSYRKRLGATLLSTQSVRPRRFRSRLATIRNLSASGPIVRTSDELEDDNRHVQVLLSRFKRSESCVTYPVPTPYDVIGGYDLTLLSNSGWKYAKEANPHFAARIPLSDTPDSIATDPKFTRIRPTWCDTKPPAVCRQRYLCEQAGQDCQTPGKLFEHAAGGLRTMPGWQLLASARANGVRVRTTEEWHIGSSPQHSEPLGGT